MFDYFVGGFVVAIEEDVDELGYVDTCGASELVWSSTLRPRGPSVTFTALAKASAPRIICTRAAPPNTIFALLTLTCFHPSPAYPPGPFRVSPETFDYLSLLHI